MERNQKRGWLKFALTTTLAVVFMLSMAVTAMANVTARLVPTEYGTAVAGNPWELALDIEVDVPAGHGVAFVQFDVLYNPAVLTPVTPIAQRIAAMEVPGGTTPVPESDDVSRLRVRFNAEGLAESVNSTDSGRMARLRFNVAEGTTLEQALVGLRLDVAEYFVDDNFASADLAVTIATPESTFSVTNVRWGFYNVNTASQAFITAVTTGPAVEWFNTAFLPALNALRAIPGFENADGPTIEANMRYWHNAANAS